MSQIPYHYYANAVAAFEKKAKKEAEPGATKLREEALLCREWIAALRSGRWHA